MSQSRLASCVPMPIEHRTLTNVIEKAKDWALMHGVGMRDKKQFSKDAMQASQFRYFPSELYSHTKKWNSVCFIDIL